MHRGSYTSVPESKDTLARFKLPPPRLQRRSRNGRAHPFTWTKIAEQILAKADRKKTSNAAY